MKSDQRDVLEAIYLRERTFLDRHQFDVWSTPAEVAQALPASHKHHGDDAWVAARLFQLWVMRKVMQVPDEIEVAHELVDVVLTPMDIHGEGEDRLAVEGNDVRGTPRHPFEQVARFGSSTHLRYRSRMLDIARLLSRNPQRFGMTPSTGLVRYERCPQLRPIRDIVITQLIAGLKSEIEQGVIQHASPEQEPCHYQLDRTIDRPRLIEAVEAVLGALRELINDSRLAVFQVESLRATLAGLYSPNFRTRFDAHVITAGVGSGKTFAFQLGALVHVAYHALLGSKKVRVLLLYPRVVLAANQFSDLFKLVAETSKRLPIGVELAEPVLDAGGNLKNQMGLGGAGEKGALYKAIKRAYHGDRQILISNLDSLANRMVHPDAARWITRDLDLIVMDEIHVLRGFYGAHARMLLKRLRLQHALWTLRERAPEASFRDLLRKIGEVNTPYFVGASATIAEPRRHAGRILDLGGQTDRILHIDVGQSVETGWVHHLFLRQRAEASSMAAVTNATSCLIHNRSDGLLPEYYQRARSEDGTCPPLAADALGNPVQPTPGIEMRDTKRIHKTVGFCDSLDGVGRWVDLVADNEGTKGSSMSASPNPAVGENVPYYARFNEPLWRVVHHLSFAAKPPAWQGLTVQSYGDLCRQCKRGIRCRIPRVPASLSPKQAEKIEEMWQVESAANDYETGSTFLRRLGVSFENARSAWYAPIVEAGAQAELDNLDGCAFFQGGLCWWWSHDHLGNNSPAPVGKDTPLNAYKATHQHNEGRYHGLAGVRVRAFTSNISFDAMSVESINDVFRETAGRIFRDIGYDKKAEDNCVLLIGSPRIEVGIDLSRARDGITFRAMRDPASLQQKAGRVGRESHSDSVILHVITENTREHYYLRNPRIALDPAYLQPIPLHENNRLVACQHYFMAIVDYLLFQAEGPGSERISADGERLALINDHAYLPDKSFKNWDNKVAAVHNFLFGTHANQTANRANLELYLKLLGASPDEITNSNAADLTEADGPMQVLAGALDVFAHDFGPKFFLSQISVQRHLVSLAMLPASTISLGVKAVIPGKPRQEHFANNYEKTGVGENAKKLNPWKNRSYLWDILRQPLFRRGLPQHNIPGNLPYLWAPNLFEPAGNEHVRIFQDRNGGEGEVGYETISLAISLLAPGSFTYRYTASPRKVAVDRFGAGPGMLQLGTGLNAVFLKVFDPEYYTLACDPIDPDDLPEDFSPFKTQVQVYVPRQLGLIRAASQPDATPSGLVIDGEEADLATPQRLALPTPPRCFALRWFRLRRREAMTLACRFQNRFLGPGETPLPALALPPVMDPFEEVRFDGRLEVTEFVWGLDRVFSNRAVCGGRLVYRQGGDEPDQQIPVALGQTFEAPGLCFSLSLGNDSPVESFLQSALEDEVSANSGQRQACLIQGLHAYLSRFALAPRDPDDAPWAPRARASTFTVSNLVKVVLFHLLESWHPEGSIAAPGAPFVFTLDDIRGCFTDGSALCITEDRFEEVCDTLAAIQAPETAEARLETLLADWANFQSACESVAELTPAWVCDQTRGVLLNTLGLTLHGAALRLTGADSSDLAYFYKVDQDRAWIYLFDNSPFGNGTVEVLRRHFYVSPAERSLVTRQSILGGAVDPLPTTDFVGCFEEDLQECTSSHASQLAYHDVDAGDLSGLRDYEGLARSERQSAGAVFDLMVEELGLSSFDYVAALQAVPEFLVNLKNYPAHATPLVPSDAYPTFQALESAMGFCHHGCISCVVNPEQNIHGLLSARYTANKLLLDAFYRTTIVEQGTVRTNACYPGMGPGRTVPWAELAKHAATAAGVPYAGLSPLNVELETDSGPDVVTVVPSTVLGAWSPVFRPSWDPAPSPEPNLRVRLGDVYPEI